MKSRVVILASQHPYNDKRVFVREARSLAAAGYEVHIIARADESEVHDRVFVHALPNGSGYMARVARLRRLYQIGLSLQGDILHCHEIDSCIVALKLRRHLRNAKVIFDVHEDYVGRLWDRLKEGAGKNPILRRLDAIPYAQIVSRVDAVITVSELLRAEMLKFHSNVTVVMNTMDLSGKGCVRDSSEPLLLSHIGELDETRGLSTIIKAIRLVTQRSIPVRLVVFGARFSKMMILAKAREHRVEGCVLIRDTLPYSDLLSALQQTHVGIVALTDKKANHLVALPTKLFDSLGAGLPVIGTEMGCIKEVLSRSNAGLTFPPGDANALAENIVFLANNEMERQKYSRAAMAAAEGEYSWRVQNQKMLALYDQLLGSQNKN